VGLIDVVTPDRALPRDVWSTPCQRETREFPAYVKQQQMSLMYAHQVTSLASIAAKQSPPIPNAASTEVDAQDAHHGCRNPGVNSNRAAGGKPSSHTTQRGLLLDLER
jgi:hypothetical protein